MPPEQESPVTTATATPPEVSPPEARPEVAPVPEAPLGEPGISALRREREARAEAERRAREAEEALRQASQREQPKREEPKAEQPKDEPKRDDEGAAKAAAATTKLRRANLLVALTEKGITGQSAKAAVRLLDAVAYDADDEPVNLDDRLEAAKAQFGSALFATPAAPEPVETSAALPETHAGVRTPAQPNEDELMAGYIATHFPHVGEDTTP